MPRIVISAGGTGGHITPLIALAEYLKRHHTDFELYYIGDKRDPATVQLFSDLGIESYGVSVGKYRRYANKSKFQQLLDIRTLSLNVRDVFRFLRGKSQAKKLLKKIQPDLVFCKGGYVCLPVGLAAKALHIPFIVHESDTRMGIANSILAKGAICVATGWPTELYESSDARFVQTGIPLRSPSTNSNEALKTFGLSEKLPIVTVFGGSLGAVSINNALLQIISHLSKQAQVVWVVGKANVDLVNKQLATTAHEANNVHVRGYVSEHYLDLLAASAVVVSRAGATSLMELASLGKASIIVPASQLGDQVKNATLLAEQQAIRMFTDDSIASEPRLLLDAIDELLTDSNARTTLGTTLATVLPANGTENVAELLLQTLQSMQADHE